MLRRSLVRRVAPLAAAAAAARSRGPAAPFASDRFSVTTHGSGPDVILIPGLGSDRSVWEGLVAALAGRFRLHLVQIGGFAGEPVGANASGELVVAPVAEDLARWIASAGIEKPAVIGHSLGATAALMLGARHPELPGRIMSVDMVPFLATVFAGADATPEKVRPRADALAKEMINASPDAFERQEAAIIAGYTQTEAARPALLQAALASDRVVMAHALRELVITDLTPELPYIVAPTTVVYAWSPGAPATVQQTDEAYRKAYERLRGVRLVRIDAAAHFVMIDQPQPFAKAVEAFLTD